MVVPDTCEHDATLLPVFPRDRLDGSSPQAPRPHSTTPPSCSLADYPRFTAEMYEEACKGFELSCSNVDMKRQVLQMLPSLSHACRLCEIFLDNGDYL